MRAFLIHCAVVGNKTSKPTDPVDPGTPGLLLGVGSHSTSLVDYPKTGPVTVGSYYVSPNGSDSNSGTTVDSPLATIGAALAKATTNQTILVREGLYNISSKILLNTNGVKLFGYGDERPKLDRGGGSAAGSAGFLMHAIANGVHVKGFEVVGGVINSSDETASHVIHIDKCEDVIFEDMIIHDGSTGSLRLTQSENCLIQDCVLFDCVGAGSGTNTPDGIVLTATSGDLCVDNAIVRCLVANGNDDCYDLFRSTSTKIIDSVAISGGHSPKNGSIIGDGNGFKMGGGVGSGYNRLTGSIAVGCWQQGLNNNSAPAGGNIYLNNTVTLNEMGMISDSGGEPGGTTNNIVLGNDDWNGNKNLGGPQSHNTYNLGITDAKFADATNGDFSLLSNSSCIGAGEGGENLGASTVALELLKKWWHHSKLYVPGRGLGKGGTGLPGDSA